MGIVQKWNMKSHLEPMRKYIKQKESVRRQNKKSKERCVNKGKIYKLSDFDLLHLNTWISNLICHQNNMT